MCEDWHIHHILMHALTTPEAEAENRLGKLKRHSDTAKLRLHVFKPELHSGNLQIRPHCIFKPEFMAGTFHICKAFPREVRRGFGFLLVGFSISFSAARTRRLWKLSGNEIWNRHSSKTVTMKMLLIKNTLHRYWQGTHKHNAQFLCHYSFNKMFETLKVKKCESHFILLCDAKMLKLWLLQQYTIFTLFALIVWFCN